MKDWLHENFWRFFCPLVIERVKVCEGGGYRGWARVYVFGIRIVCVQMTNPWGAS